MKIALAVRRLHPRQVFRIARARREFVENVFVRVEQDGVFGYGEASPNEFYGESAADVAAKLGGLRDFVATLRITSHAEIADCWERVWPLLQPSRASQCALDVALWDWLMRSRGWAPPPQPIKTFCTIGLSTPEELEEKLEALQGFAAIKLKSDAQADLSPVRRVRASSEAILAVDANCAWGAFELSTLVQSLMPWNVAFVEQPFAPTEDAQLTRGTLPVPILADESCVVESDVERVAEHFDGFNVKLVKCGGLTPAVRMLARGRSLGCKTMVGCMLESSLLISAGMLAAREADYADLDGAWLLRDDPCPGLTFDRGVLSQPLAPGLGVTPQMDFE